MTATQARHEIARRLGTAGRMTILIVDDDAEIRLIAGHVLTAAGHDVAHAIDARSARAALEARHAEVILMDVRLGEEDGIAVADELLRSARPRPQLVFLTAATGAQDAARMQASGAAGILQKPFDPTTLQVQLEQLLARDA